MKRITLWLLSTLSVVVLLFGYDASNATTGPPTSIISSGSGTTTGSAGSGTTTGSSGSGTTTGSAGSGGATTNSSAATTVKGGVASTQWGPVQVQLTVSSGDITRVDVLQYPSGNSKDAEINNYALPILIQETTDQQSAGIDMVSGATVTSVGYIQSLQSAIDQAGL